MRNSGIWEHGWFFTGLKIFVVFILTCFILAGAALAEQSVISGASGVVQEQAAPKEPLLDPISRLKAVLDSYKTGDFQESLRLLKGLTEADKGHEELRPISLMLEGLACHRLAYTERARNAWGKMAETAPDDELTPWATMLLGVQFTLLNEKEAACQAFRAVINNYSPGEAAGNAFAWLEFYSVETDAGAENTPKLGDNADDAVKRIFGDKNDLAGIPADNEQFELALRRANELDVESPDYTGAESDSAMAREFYLKAFAFKPASRDDGALALRLARIYYNHAVTRGDVKGLENAAFILKHVVTTSNSACAPGLMARLLLMDCLLTAGRESELNELPDHILDAIWSDISMIKDESPKQITRLKRTRSRIIQKSVELGVRDDGNSHEGLAAILTRIIRHNQGIPLSREAMRGMARIHRHNLVRAASTNPAIMEQCLFRTPEAKVFRKISERLSEYE